MSGSEMRSIRELGLRICNLRKIRILVSVFS